MRFLKTSIRNKLIALLLISTVVPVVTSTVITYVYTKNSFKQLTIEENTRLMAEGKTNIVNYLDSINSASLAIYSTPLLNSILWKGLDDYLTEPYIFTTMQALSRAAKEIYQINLSIDQFNRSFLLYRDALTRGPLYPADKADTLKPYSVFMEATHASHSYGAQPISPQKPDLVFTIHRPLYRVPTTERIGMLSIDVKVEALRKLSAQLYEQGKEQFYIADKNGTIVYASDEAQIGEPLNEPWFSKISALANPSGSMEWNKPDFSGIIIYSKMSSSLTDWIVVKRIPYKLLLTHTHRLTLINSAVAGIFLIVAITGVLVISVRFTKPIKELIRRMNKIQTGKLDEPIVIDREDEIGILAGRFRTMMHTINNLILREYKLDLANKTNQLKMLQAQINPHFINNALQSIGSAALESNAPEVYSLVSSLGQMMHYSMNTKETIVPLAKEIEYVNFYLVLQQQRFGNKLVVEYDIDEQTGSFPIPKMIVQPIVENFFKHGFSSSRKDFILRIRTCSQNNMLCIVVEDNGSGIAEERLRVLQSDLSGTGHHLREVGERIGLLNVLFRLRLYFGEQADLGLSNCQPHGLQVKLTIPQTIIGEEFA
ncbi:sensor histidine kinase [Paenibacillus sp. GCM10027626]|uniref:cache domain-containing sensor histidine kinase n=1 Tax=Paenibacillus sp. GCM10027626 TaxID=3273411 RepID=UPI003644A921